MRTIIDSCGLEGLDEVFLRNVDGRIELWVKTYLGAIEPVVVHPGGEALITFTTIATGKAPPVRTRVAIRNPGPKPKPK